jgi:hypothetical protein
MVYLREGGYLKMGIFRKTSLILLVFITFSYTAQAGSIFNELVEAIQQKYVQLRLAEVGKKYKARNIEGRAYIVNITNDVSGHKVVTLSTEKDRTHPDAVTIIVYLRKYFDKSLLRFKVGDRAYCFGPFKEFRMRSIIIDGGFIK